MAADGQTSGPGVPFRDFLKAYLNSFREDFAKKVPGPLLMYRHSKGDARIVDLSEQRSRGKTQFTVGRDESADLCIRDSLISRHHGRITFNGSLWTFTDLNSRNGSFQAEDDTRITPQHPVFMEDKKSIRIGDHGVLQFWTSMSLYKSLRDRKVERRKSKVLSLRNRKALLDGFECSPHPRALREIAADARRLGSADFRLRHPLPFIVLQGRLDDVTQAGDDTQLIEGTNFTGLSGLSTVFWVAPLRTEGEMINIGRDGNSHICILHQSVSRNHAGLRRKGRRYLLEDLGSRNGVFVGSQRVRQPILLDDASEFRLGNLELQLFSPNSFHEFARVYESGIALG